MTQKPRRQPITETAVENIKETSHWVFAIAPIIASILATLFGKDTHVLEFTFIVLAILVNFFILWLKSRTEENKELSLYYTFWTNNLPPNRTGDEQRYKVEIAVIEAKESAYFRDNLKRKFKTEPKLKNPNLVEVRDSHLYFRLLDVRPPTKDKMEEVETAFKADLDDDLENATAVVVVRTSELDGKPWVYKAVDSWAYEHSDVPILVAKNPSKEYPENEIADRYLQIPDDPNSLPWRLLQRARDRALAWRSQASFNRAMVTNIFFLSLMCIWIGSFWIKSLNINIQNKTSEYDTAIQNEKRKSDTMIQNKVDEYATAIEGMYEVVETKEFFKRNYIKNEDFINGEDAKLDISYWFRHNGNPYIFVTTEKGDTQKWYENDKSSIIGCGFFDPSKVVECKGDCKNPANTRVYDFDGNEKIDHGCTMRPRDDEPISSIVCVAYQPSGNLSREATVGICAFTGGRKPILIDGYREYLRQRADVFYQRFGKRIADKKVTPLAERPRQQF